MVIAPRVGARLDRREAVASVRVRQGPPRAAEIRIDWRLVLIAHVDVSPGRVRLPDLDKGIRNRPSVLVDHASRDDDALPKWFAGVLAGEVRVLGPHGLVP